MTDYAPKPTANTPVALRLLTRITGWPICTLVRFLIEPVDYGPPGAVDYHLQVYQWNNGANPTLKPTTALTSVLELANKADSERDAIAAIPPDLFVYSDDLDGGYIEFENNRRDEPILAHEQPDWRPNIHGIVDLVEQCPEQLTNISSLADAKKARTREVGKAETAARHKALQSAFDALKQLEEQKAVAQELVKEPTKKSLCLKLAADKSANPTGLTADSIERIVKVR